MPQCLYLFEHRGRIIAQDCDAGLGFKFQNPVWDFGLHFLDLITGMSPYLVTKLENAKYDARISESKFTPGQNIKTKHPTNSTRTKSNPSCRCDRVIQAHTSDKINATTQ